MIHDAKNYPISTIFTTDMPIVYIIPPYQREYSWGKQQWEALFDDILENERGHFLGTIICINETSDSFDVQKIELIDGQQRLTTLSLLFAAIYHALTTQDGLDESQQRKRDMVMAKLRERLVLSTETGKPRLNLQRQNNNDADYRAVLSEIGLIAGGRPPQYAGNRKIFRAYRYFEARIAEVAHAEKSPAEAIEQFLQKVWQASMVKIEVKNHADAYILFESLNNRGMPLTAIDLIKNKLLAKSDADSPTSTMAYYESWKQLLEYLGDDYAIQERFFRQYYNAFRDQLKHICQVPVATRSNLIQIYEKLINADAKGCLEKLCSAGRIYGVLLSRNEEDCPEALKKPLKGLERIQGAPAYLLLLYLMVRQEELRLTTAQVALVAELLVRFFVRRNLTDTPPTRDLIPLFMNIISELNAKGYNAAAIPAAIEQKLVNASATDEEFRRKLEGPIYEENTGVTRFILCALAEKDMTRESMVDLWKVENNRQFTWTIEHIFPQGERIPDEWVAMMAGGDKEKAKELQQSHVHKLGNLTISGFNSQLGNQSFTKKRDRTDHAGRPIGYANGLKLNEDLARASGWSVDQIDARTQKLVEQAMELFKLQQTSAARA